MCPYPCDGICNAQNPRHGVPLPVLMSLHYACAHSNTRVGILIKFTARAMLRLCVADRTYKLRGVRVQGVLDRGGDIGGCWNLLAVWRARLHVGRHAAKGYRLLPKHWRHILDISSLQAEHPT